jgi:putative transposase
MNELVKIDRNQKIKQAILETRDRHANMTCKTYEVKIDKSHISKTKSSFLQSVFREAKWLYNHVLSSDDIFAVPDNTKEVTVLNKDKIPEIRKLDNLSSHMVQEVIARTKINIVALSRSKEVGNKIGKLKYKSQVNSVPLKQYNNTYKVKGKSIKIQGCKKPFRVIGLEQLPPDAELTKATLIRRLGDYYINITCYVNKIPKIITGNSNSIGLDFGIKDNIVTSNGDKINFSFPESKQLKKASRKFNKAKKGSKNRYKRKLKLAKEYQKQNNRKKEAQNQYVHELTSNYDHICIQDENLAAWKGSHMKGWGKRIQHSIMGGIISALKLRPETHIVDRFAPTTQLCPDCGSKNKHELDQRTYECACGYTCDRDTHAARNILMLGLRTVPTEHRNLNACGEVTSTPTGTAGDSGCKLPR